MFLLDIDECVVDNGGCNQICINTPGSSECVCKDGYALGSDGKTCAGTIHFSLDTMTFFHALTVEQYVNFA